MIRSRLANAIAINKVLQTLNTTHLSAVQDVLIEEIGSGDKIKFMQNVLFNSINELTIDEKDKSSRHHHRIPISNACYSNGFIIKFKH